jgi:uncharacterized protein (DUF433 family)
MAAETFTPTEAAAFLDFPERQVRKEVEHGLFSTELDFTALVYLGALRGLGLSLGVEDRRKLFEIVTREVGRTRATPNLISFSPVLKLRLGPTIRQLRRKLERFTSWKRKLAVNPKILGGEPVFRNSRLSVRSIGGLLDRGASPESIREDYPYLDYEDLEFARIFARAYPRVGRPRETGQAPAR